MFADSSSVSFFSKKRKKKKEKKWSKASTRALSSCCEAEKLGGCWFFSFWVPHLIKPTSSSVLAPPTAGPVALWAHVRAEHEDDVLEIHSVWRITTSTTKIQSFLLNVLGKSVFGKTLVIGRRKKSAPLPLNLFSSSLTGLHLCTDEQQSAINNQQKAEVCSRRLTHCVSIQMCKFFFILFCQTTDSQVVVCFFFMLIIQLKNKTAPLRWEHQFASTKGGELVGPGVTPPRHVHQSSSSSQKPPQSDGSDSPVPHSVNSCAPDCCFCYHGVAGESWFTTRVNKCLRKSSRPVPLTSQTSPPDRPHRS